MSARRLNVRAMTWNIHGGIGPDGRRDLSRTTALIRRHDPDILALQEVDSRTRKGSAEPAFDLLRKGLGEHSAEARLITAPDGDYGHVVISRWPLTGTHRHDVSAFGREPRAAIETTIATPFGPLQVLAAHLGLGFSERRTQAAQLAAVVESGPTRTIMLGDFNDWGWPGYVHRALADLFPDRTSLRTFPARLPLLSLDRIYCRPAGMLVRSWTDASARSASDHPPVIGDLQLTFEGH